MLCINANLGYRLHALAACPLSLSLALSVCVSFSYETFTTLLLSANAIRLCQLLLARQKTHTYSYVIRTPRKPNTAQNADVFCRPKTSSAACAIADGEEGADWYKTLSRLYSTLGHKDSHSRCPAW